MNRKWYVGVTVSLFLFISQALFAQGALHPEWLIKRISPVSNEKSEGWGVDVDASGYVYWATTQFMPGRGLDVVLYKLDADSNEVWTAPTVFGDLYRQVSHVVKVAGDRAYVGGINNHAFSLSSSDMLVLAVDTATGDTLWSTVWDQGYGYEEVDDVLVGSDGIYVTGWTTGDTTRLDIALLRLDFDGNIVQASTWGTELQDHQDGHAVMDESTIYLAGLYGSPDPLAVFGGVRGAGVSG
jgi:outer membrane protein assembly factor BamB